jgi:hypothetical protein
MRCDATEATCASVGAVMGASSTIFPSIANPVRVHNLTAVFGDSMART